MRVYYAAVEQIAPPPASARSGPLICLVRYDPRDPEGYIFGYKDIEELMGPHECDCPETILDLLTPTDRPLRTAMAGSLPRRRRRPSRQGRQTEAARRASDRLRRTARLFRWPKF